MKRCLLRALPCAALWLGLLGISAQAQTLQRPFPATAYRGEITITQPPLVQLNGQEDRLAPGARIRSTSNMIVLSGSLVGEKLTVNYTREFTGLIQDVWILTEQEIAQKRDKEPRKP